MDRARLIAVLGPHAADFLAGVGAALEDLAEDRIEALRAPPTPPPFLHHGDPYKDRPGILRRVGQLLSAPSVQAVLAGLDEDMEGSQRVRLYRGVRGLVKALAAAPERSVEQLRGLWETALAAVPGSRRVQAGTGLAGGGALSGDVTISHASGLSETFENPSSITVVDGHVTAVSEGAAASSLDVAEEFSYMDGSLGGTWWFRRGSGAGGGPATIYVGDGLTKADGNLYSYRIVVCLQEPVPVDETLEIHVYRYVAGDWTIATSVSAPAGSYRAITPAFTLSAGQLLAVASIAEGAGGAHAQLTVRRG